MIRTYFFLQLDVPNRSVKTKGREIFYFIANNFSFLVSIIEWLILHPTPHLDGDRGGGGGAGWKSYLLYALHP